MTVKTVYYCKEGHEPVALVRQDPCPTCGKPMSIIGWMETNESKETGSAVD